MSLKIMSAGFGRTGTMSLKLALEQLGLAPCYHMVEVVERASTHAPLWNDVLDGKPDFAAIFKGFSSAVDWPAAAYWQEIQAAYPDMRMILSTRSPESWWNSISQTILPSLLAAENAPPHLRPWLDMVYKVVVERSLGGATDKDGAIAAFKAHEADVKAAFAPGNLLVHQAKDGWKPLCNFLGVPVPETPYPRTNSTEEFHDLMKSIGEGEPQ